MILRHRSFWHISSSFSFVGQWDWECLLRSLVAGIEIEALGGVGFCIHDNFDFLGEETQIERISAKRVLGSNQEFGIGIDFFWGE